MKYSPRIFVLFVAATSACQSTHATKSWLPPANALQHAHHSANPIDSFDLTAVMGNDLERAQRDLDSALAKTPDNVGLLSRRAYLSTLMLDDESWLKDLLMVLRLAPDSHWAQHMLTQLHNRTADLFDHRDKIIVALNHVVTHSESPTSIALATRLSYAISDYDGAAKEAEAALKRGGWLHQGQILGPIAPYLFHSLNNTAVLTQSKPLGPVTFAGTQRTPRKLTKKGTSLPLNHQEQTGLYAVDTYFRLPQSTQTHEIDLQVQSNTRYRVAVDEEEVISRGGQSPLRPRHQVIRLKLSEGWHRIRIVALTSATQSMHVSILDANARPIVTEQSAVPQKTAGKNGIEVVGVWPLSDSTFFANRIESYHSKFDHLTAALHALQPWNNDLESARRLIRPIEKAAQDSSIYHLVAARLLEAESSAVGHQLVHLRRSQKLTPKCALALFRLARKTLSDNPDQALLLADQLQSLGANPTKFELIRFAVYKKRNWLVEADKVYRRLLTRWQPSDILLSILTYFRNRRSMPDISNLEALILKQSGNQRLATQTDLALFKGDDSAVAKAYDTALAKPGDRIRDLLRQANHRLARGHTADALAGAKEVLKTRPRSRRALRIVMSALQILGEDKQLDDVIEQSRELHSGDIDFETFVAHREGRLPGLPKPNSRLAELLKIDARAIAQTALEKRWDRHGKVRLLDRHVDYLHKDGRVLSMTHFLTRILTKEAADQVGEIALGRNVIPLELRTLKADGQIVEVERHQGKKDLSYAALAPGDTIENQTARMNGARTRSGGYQQIFYFQDTAPNLRGELFLVVPKGVQVKSISYNGAPEAQIIEDGENEIYMWRSEPLAGLIPEPYSVSSKEYVPFVVVSVGLSETDARVENGALFDGAFASTFDVIHKAESLVSNDDTALQKTTKLYRWVLQEIKEGGAFSPADTLKNKRGNRIGLLKTMLDAVGVKVDLVLARSNRNFSLSPPYPNTKGHGIMILKVNTESESDPIWIRASSKLTWMGKVQPDFRGSTYVNISDPHFKEQRFKDEEIAEWKSHSSLKIRIDKENLARGTLEVQLPAAIGQPLRTSLESVPDKDKTKILSRWIGNIIRGFDATGFEYLTNRDPLIDPKLRVNVVASNFVHVSGDTLVIPHFFDNLIAAQMIGTPKMSSYIKLSERKTPLQFQGLREEMLVEVSFDGPAGKPKRSPKSWGRNSKWGNYKQSFEWDPEKRAARLLRIVDMPAARITTKEYVDFLDLARELRLRARNQLVISFK
jgi:hypothetical protein